MADETKYYFASTGEFLGGFNDGSLNLVPSDAVQVAEPPNNGLDRLVNGVVVPYVEPKTINQKLEEAMLPLLQRHLGHPYLTAPVIKEIMNTKQGVTNANQIDPSGYLAKATLMGVTLPPEMETDRQALLNMFPG